MTVIWDPMKIEPPNELNLALVQPCCFKCVHTSLQMAETRLEESKQKNIEDNMQKVKNVNEMQNENYIVTVELETSRGDAKDLTAELDALREHKNSWCPRIV